MSVKGWEFKTWRDNTNGDWHAYGSCKEGKGRGSHINCGPVPTEAEAQADFARLESQVLAFELAGRGVDVKEMVRALRYARPYLVTPGMVWAVNLIEAFDAALAEVEGKEEGK